MSTSLVLFMRQVFMEFFYSFRDKFTIYILAFCILSLSLPLSFSLSLSLFQSLSLSLLLYFSLILLFTSIPSFSVPVCLSEFIYFLFNFMLACAFTFLFFPLFYVVHGGCRCLFMRRAP